MLKTRRFQSRVRRVYYLWLITRVSKGRRIDLSSLRPFTFNSDCYLLGFLSITPEAEVSARFLAGFETSLNGLFARRYR